MSVSDVCTDTKLSMSATETNLTSFVDRMQMSESGACWDTDCTLYIQLWMACRRHVVSLSVVLIACPVDGRHSRESQHLNCPDEAAAEYMPIG